MALFVLQEQSETMTLNWIVPVLNINHSTYKRSLIGRPEKCYTTVSDLPDSEVP